MLQERLKCKQLEEKVKSIQRELDINKHKVHNVLNEDFIEIISSKSENYSLYEAFLGTTGTLVHIIFFLRSSSSRDYLFLFICSFKITFCLGGASQYRHFTSSKCTHPKILKKNSYNQSEIF